MHNLKSSDRHSLGYRFVILLYITLLTQFRLNLNKFDIILTIILMFYDHYGITYYIKTKNYTVKFELKTKSQLKQTFSLVLIVAGQRRQESCAQLYPSLITEARKRTRVHNHGPGYMFQRATNHVEFKACTRISAQ